MFESEKIVYHPHDAEEILNFKAMDTDSHTLYDITCKACEVLISEKVGSFYFVKVKDSDELAVSTSDLNPYFDIQFIS